MMRKQQHAVPQAGLDTHLHVRVRIEEQPLLEISGMQVGQIELHHFHGDLLRRVANQDIRAMTIHHSRGVSRPADGHHRAYSSQCATGPMVVPKAHIGRLFDKGIPAVNVPQDLALCGVAGAPLVLVLEKTQRIRLI